MLIRLATAGDVSDLFALNALLGNTATADSIRKSLRENEREIVCISCDDGRAVGYASALIIESMCYEAKRADMESLYVTEEYRGRGLGTALIKYLEAKLTARGIYHFHINTQAANSSARSLYTNLGYTQTGEILLHKSTWPKKI